MCLNGVEHASGARQVGIDGAAECAVVAEGVERGVGHGVHGVRADQLVHVQRVGIGRVLGARGSPQRTLHLRAECCEPVPARPAEQLPEAAVGHLRLRHRSAASQRQRVRLADGFEPAVDLGVGAADEERGHAGHARQVGDARGRPVFEAAQVRLGHLLVAGHREDQGHVDAASLGDHLPDGGQTLDCAGNLHHEVRPCDPLVQGAGSSGGGVGVVRQRRVDFNRHEAIGAARGRMHPFERSQSASDVAGDELPVGVVDRGAAAHQIAELLVVVAGRLDGLLKDRRIRREPADALRNPRIQLAAGNPPPAQIVQPRALPALCVQPRQAPARCTTIAVAAVAHSASPSSHPCAVSTAADASRR